MAATVQTLEQTRRPPPWETSDKEIESLLRAAPYSVAWGSSSLVGQDVYREAQRVLPTEKWIHLRFCSSYQVHGWVHSQFTRVLLRNAYAVSRSFPDDKEIFAAVHVGSRLVHRLPSEIWREISRFLLDMIPINDYYKLAIPSLTERERGMCAIFSDDDRLWTELYLDLTHYFMDPLRDFPDSPDVLSLPLIRMGSRLTPRRTVVLNDVECRPADCVCGQCPQILRQYQSNPRKLSTAYFEIVNNASRRGCWTLKHVLEPALNFAEGWFDSLLERIELLGPSLVWIYEYRPGPAVCEAAALCGFTVGQELSVNDLLWFMTLLPHLVGARSVAIVPHPLDVDDLGYFGFLEDGRTQIYARCGWLYELPCVSGETPPTVAILSNHADFAIRIVPHDGPGPFPFEMDFRKTDKPYLVPLMHEEEVNSAVVAEESLNNASDYNVHMTIIIILADRPSGFDLRLKWCALLRCGCLGRTFETIWRPNVESGRSCEHRSLYRVMTRCSLSAMEIIVSVEMSDQDVFAKPSPPKDITREAIAAWQFQMEEGARYTCSAIKRLSSFAEGHVCLVRCSVTEGPPEPIVILAAAAGKKVYIFHRK